MGHPNASSNKDNGRKYKKTELMTNSSRFLNENLVFCFLVGSDGFLPVKAGMNGLYTG